MPSKRYKQAKKCYREMLDDIGKVMHDVTLELEHCQKRESERAAREGKLNRQKTQVFKIVNKRWVEMLHIVCEPDLGPYIAIIKGDPYPVTHSEPRYFFVERYGVECSIAVHDLIANGKVIGASERCETLTN